MAQIKKCWFTNNIKNRGKKTQKISTQIGTCYYFDGLIKIKHFEFVNIIVVGKPYDNK